MCRSSCLPLPEMEAKSPLLQTHIRDDQKAIKSIKLNNVIQMNILADSVCLLMHCKCEETDFELSGPDENKKRGHYCAMFLKATIH